MNRLRTVWMNLVLILKCYLYFLHHGKADKKIVDPKSIVIIQRGQFGDMIATTPMYRAVRKSYPKCSLAVIGGAINKKTMDGNPDIDQYIVWEDDISKMVKILREGQYDFGCITGPNFHSLAALYLGEVKCITVPVIRNGWSPYETRPYKLLAKFVLTKEHWMRRYVPREFLKLLEPIEIYTSDTKKYIYWTDAAEKKMGDLVREARKGAEFLVGIMPGAGNRIKQWPAGRFSKVADYLIEKYNARVLIIGSDSNRKEIEEMMSGVSNKDRVTDTSYTTIDEVKALVSKLDFTVSVDTGPVFIAEASGVPTVDIAGSIDPKEMAPNDGKYHLVVTSVGEPQIMTMNARVFDYEEAKRQIDNVTVSMVLKVVDEIVDRVKRKPK